MGRTKTIMKQREKGLETRVHKEFPAYNNVPAPSQKWYLYDKSTFPSRALESIDWAPKVMETIHKGRERPATKKFSAFPCTKKSVAIPMRKETAMAAIMAMENPVIKKTRKEEKKQSIKSQKEIQTKKANTDSQIKQQQEQLFDKP